MRFTPASESPAQVAADLLAVPCATTSPDACPIPALDAKLEGALSREKADASFNGKAGQVLLFPTMGLLPARRIALIGTGPEPALSTAAIRRFAALAVRQAKTRAASRLAIVAPASATHAEPAAQAIVEGVLLGAYKFDRYLSPDPSRAAPPDEIVILGAPGAEDHIARGIRRAQAVLWARDLVNEPAGHLTPAVLADAACERARQHGLQSSVLGPDQCRERGMNLFLAVAQGSPQEPRFIHLTWKPVSARKRVVIVGKGVTFDSGGLSLKPSASMLDMKTDMAGAAAVLAAMAVVAQEEMPLEVHALAACTENMISGPAYKLGDVLRSKAGKTVEITNTDAEGRLTLADALAYARELAPDIVIDLATLTGACVVALGPHIAGVMGNTDSLRDQWLTAARVAGEETWPLPLSDSLSEQLKSEIADMKNSGERWGGALTAGLFLKEFAGDVPWLHVDIAGPSAADKDDGHITKGGTGFGVASILEFLARLAHA